jgi:hypothetical protein
MRLFILLFVVCCPSLRVFGQIYIGQGVNLQIKPNVTISYGGLALEPSSEVTLSDLTISASKMPTTSPESIAGVYNFSAPVSFAGTINIRYLDADLNGLSESLLKIASRPNTTSGFSVVSASLVDADANQVTAVYATPISLGQVTAVEGSENPLPVNLLSFKALINERSTVTLNWVTVSEVQTEYFDVERSEDAKAWTCIGRVKARGNGHGITPYNFTDHTHTPEIVYYRLKMVDKDNTHSYSHIESLSSSNPLSSVRLYPNPVIDRLKFGDIAPTAVREVEVYNSRGHKVYSDNKITDAGILLRSQPVGVYTVRLIGSHGEVVTKNVIINK